MKCRVKREFEELAYYLVKEAHPYETAVINVFRMEVQKLRKGKNNEKNIFVTNIIMHYKFKFKCFNNERENSAGFVKNWGEAGNYL